MKLPTRFLALLSIAVLAPACSIPVQPARLVAGGPAMPREQEAQVALESRACDPSLGFLYPGLGQFCLRRPFAGVALASLATTELALLLGAAQQFDSNSPQVILPAVALQNTYVIGAVDTLLVKARAKRLPFTPQDSLEEMLLAPVNPRVLALPEVWIALALTAVAQSALVWHGGERFRNAHDDVDVLGRRFAPIRGQIAANGIMAGTFAHVALGEEMLFRGQIQSALARKYGPGAAWATGSLFFGAIHAPNALLYDDPKDRRDYLLYGLPVVTAVGAYISATYHWNDYSLTAPIALHFWYNLLTGAASMLADPQNGFVSATVSVPW